MIDYKKAHKAYELLKQSNVPFMVVYGNKDGETITFGVSGNYRILRCCLAQLIAEMGNAMRRNRGEEAAIEELELFFAFAEEMLRKNDGEGEECQMLN